MTSESSTKADGQNETTNSTILDTKQEPLFTNERRGIDFREDIITKAGLREFYEKRCLPYIGENPTSKIEPIDAPWTKYEPDPEDYAPSLSLTEMVLCPDIEVLQEWRIPYNEQEYARMLDLRPGPIPGVDVTPYLQSIESKKSAPVDQLGLPMPTLTIQKDADLSSPVKSSSGKEDGYIDVDDSRPSSEKKKKKKKKRKHDREGEEDGEERKKKKKKKKKSKKDRHSSEEE